MRTRLHVIYVPGLGDKRATGQGLVVVSWRLWGVESELVQMRWATDEPWDAKLARLLARIDAAVADGKRVALVGSSAGASAVMNAYAVRKQLVGCVLIAGKVNRPEVIRQNYRQENPAFVVSMQRCQEALASLDAADRSRILSRYAVFDEILPRVDSRVAGARNRVVPTIGHAFTIATQLIFGAPSFIWFLRQTAGRS